MAGVLLCAPALSQLRVKTDITGVDVLIDGREMGQTPLSLGSIPPGKHRIELRKEGYETAVREVEVVAGAAMLTITVAMKSRPAALPRLPVEFAGVHFHRGGRCYGSLRITTAALSYKSSDDHFDIPFEQIRFVGIYTFNLTIEGIDVSRNPEVKPCRVESRGRSYNFSVVEPAEESLSAPKTLQFCGILSSAWIAWSNARRHSKP
jgi:hypothetical protein